MHLPQLTEEDIKGVIVNQGLEEKALEKEESAISSWRSEILMIL